MKESPMKIVNLSLDEQVDMVEERMIYFLDQWGKSCRSSDGFDGFYQIGRMEEIISSEMKLLSRRMHGSGITIESE